VHLEVHAPDAAIGDITGDLAARRGQVNGTDSSLPGSSIVRGLAPLAELSNYQSRLNAMSSGQGRYSVQLSHHEPVPPHTQSQLIAAYKGQEED